MEEDEINVAEKEVKVKIDDHFLLLDMKLTWKEDDLEFSVYNKENQMIKYLNSKSCHRSEVFKAMSAGLFTCLGRLTLLTEENKNEK
eukprot:15353421-Ditylum_brightwellii.AAC.2